MTDFTAMSGIPVADTTRNFGIKLRLPAHRIHFPAPCWLDSTSLKGIVMEAIGTPGPIAPASASTTTLAYLPIGMFGSVMGLSGLSIAWRGAKDYFGAPVLVAQVLGWCGLLAFLALVVAYAVKAWAGFSSVRAEFKHPVSSNLFGTLMISLLLLPLVLFEYSLTAARLLWVFGAAGMIGLAFTIVIRWMTVRQAVAQVTPPWIVPVVGMLDIPLAIPHLQWSGLHGLMVFGLSVGLFFAIPLFTMIFSRLAMEEPLAPPLQPSLLILVAPFSVGFSSYVATTGSIDMFAQALYMLMLFMLTVLLGRLRHLPQCSFRVSWWAASFPLAASAAASIRYASYAKTVATDAIAIVVLAIATLIIIMFLIQTLLGIGKGKFQRLVQS
jgi:tellurite resistance protein